MLTRKGEPVAEATVVFFPIDNTPGQGATGYTSADGQFTLSSRHGPKGAIPGTYKVAVNKWVLPDGKVLPPDTESPIDHPYKEVMPLRSASVETTTVTVTVPPEGGPVDNKLTP